MAQFRVCYHFDKDDVQEEIVEAHDRMAAEHQVYRKADPGYAHQTPLSDIEKGSTMCLFVKAAVRYIWIRAVPEQDGS